MEMKREHRPCPGWESPCGGWIFGEADYCAGCIGTRRFLASVSRRWGPGMPDDDPDQAATVPLLPQDGCFT